MRKTYYDDWDKPKRGWGQVFKFILILLAAAVLLLVFFVIYMSSSDFREDKPASLNLTPTPVPTLVAHASQTPPIELYAPLADAISQNPDTVAWVSIEGTLVNYPVVRTNSNKYYMENGYDKAPNSAGAIFLDKDSDPAGVHLVVYGKAMADGSRFAALLKYRKESYMLQNSIITLETSAGTQQYQIFAAYFQPQDFNPLQARFDALDVWLAHVEKCAGYSIYTGDYGDGWSRVLTLVSVYEETGENFIVQAGLIS